MTSVDFFSHDVFGDVFRCSYDMKSYQILSNGEHINHHLKHFKTIFVHIFHGDFSYIYKPSIDVQWISIDVGESEAQDICGHFGLAGVAPV